MKTINTSTSGTPLSHLYNAQSRAFPLRVMLYSHDSWGLGHLRRSLSIAETLTEHFSHCNVLLVTGSPCATQFDLPDQCDVLKLPAVSKDLDGHYVPRSMSGDIDETISLREQLINTSYQAFDPHLIIVDHQLTGLMDEALSMLRQARADRKVLVYGMRDVLDSPEVVEQSWNAPNHRWALDQAYDRICIYGSPSVFDPRRQYPALARVSSKSEFMGYVCPSLNLSQRHPVPTMRKKVIVTMGGGEDGADRISTYLDAVDNSQCDWDTHIVTGPLLDRAKARHFRRRVFRMGMGDRIRISHFHGDIIRLLQNADAVVSMAGYNSCAEIMRAGIPAVLLPRSHPRKEQLIRARRLEQLGLARCVTDLNPEHVRSALMQILQTGLDHQSMPDLDGRRNICQTIEQLVSSHILGLTQDSEPLIASGE